LVWCVVSMFSPSCFPPSQSLYSQQARQYQSPCGPSFARCHDPYFGGAVITNRKQPGRAFLGSGLTQLFLTQYSASAASIFGCLNFSTFQFPLHSATIVLFSPPRPLLVLPHPITGRPHPITRYSFTLSVNHQVTPHPSSIHPYRVHLPTCPAGKQAWAPFLFLLQWRTCKWRSPPKNKTMPPKGGR